MDDLKCMSDEDCENLNFVDEVQPNTLQIPDDPTADVDTQKNNPAGSDDSAKKRTQAAKKPASKKGKPSSKKKPPKKLSTKRMMVNLLIKIGAIVLVVWMLFTFVLSFTIHYGNNMHPSVRDGDLIIGFRMQRPYINAAVVYEHGGRGISDA